MPRPAIVLAHPRYGIYVGAVLGTGYWTTLDSNGQSSVRTFPTKKAARAMAGMMLLKTEMKQCEYVPVPAAGTHASVSQLKAVGLGDWLGRLEANEEEFK